MALGVVEVIWASIAFSRYRGAIPNGRTEAAASEIRQLDEGAGIGILGLVGSANVDLVRSI